LVQDAVERVLVVFLDLEDADLAIGDVAIVVDQLARAFREK